jgi:hypothetical protein
VLTTCQPSTVWCSRERLPAAAAQPAKVRQSCSATDDDDDDDDDYYYYLFEFFSLLYPVYTVIKVVSIELLEFMLKLQPVAAAPYIPVSVSGV